MTGERRFLKAIVALWLTTHGSPLDGTNAPRELVDEYDFFGAASITERLIESGHLQQVGPDEHTVVPTAKGIFEVLT